ncbi:MAG TPA: LytTR family DNA-binding domain-containing protein [Bacteroidales bacterium]|nr:LytTR family DNA-binding domain-containing protein [Bacteroidales bacterium]
MQINCIVIEDEPLAIKKLTGFISRVEYLQLSRTFDNAIDAISYLKENPVDLIFLDIQMEEFTGIQFLETIRQRPQVIITTAYDKYAVKGYELDVADYLLKPFTFERFIQSVEKIHKTISEKPTAASVQYIFVKTEYRLEKINVSDILYIQGMNEYLRIVTDEKKIMTRQTFKSIEELLPKDNFIRVHKSYLVAIDKVESIERNRIKIQKMLIPISETYKESFFNKIGVTK